MEAGACPQPSDARRRIEEVDEVCLFGGGLGGIGLRGVRHASILAATTYPNRQAGDVSNDARITARGIVSDLRIC
jgi:hypothetical protein